MPKLRASLPRSARRRRRDGRRERVGRERARFLLRLAWPTATDTPAFDTPPQQQPATDPFATFGGGGGGFSGGGRSPPTRFRRQCRPPHRQRRARARRCDDAAVHAAIGPRSVCEFRRRRRRRCGAPPMRSRCQLHQTFHRQLLPRIRSRFWRRQRAAPTGATVPTPRNTAPAQPAADPFASSATTCAPPVAMASPDVAPNPFAVPAPVPAPAPPAPTSRLPPRTPTRSHLRWHAGGGAGAGGGENPLRHQRLQAARCSRIRLRHPAAARPRLQTRSHPRAGVRGCGGGQPVPVECRRRCRHTAIGHSVTQRSTSKRHEPASAAALGFSLPNDSNPRRVFVRPDR